MLRQRLRCDAPIFSSADYEHIMQCRDERPRSKVLNDLKDKYNTSQKRIYQIWRGEEKSRVAWDQPINIPTPPLGSLSRINTVDEQSELEIRDQGNSAIIEFENMMHDIE